MHTHSSRTRSNRKYVEYIANQRLLGGVDVFDFVAKRILISILFIVIGLFFIVRFEIENNIIGRGAFFVLIFILVRGIIYEYVRSKVRKESLKSILAEYHLLQSVIPAREAKIRARVFGTIGIAIFLTILTPSKEEFKEYYRFYNPDSHIIAVDRKYKLINADYQVKLQSGEIVAYRWAFVFGFWKIKEKDTR